MFSIVVKTSLSFENLMNKCWDGAIDTLKTVSKYGREEDLMSFLVTSVFANNIPDIVEVNDFLWLESDWIFKMIGILDIDI